ncbi:hypothetical protein JX265_013383 [Neoarthrinium moseri]|uniref:Rhodopsin domain-containing protein n=1 Tax=Neoarthrinium moseri TaxID=1658444 RepID=A0A9P9W8S3_9PEZI|nr:hypothetical protein JX265_013383 [Neoarthrinium moseri]
MASQRAVHHFVSPEKEVDAGIWTLFSGATLFLSFRIWCKVRRHYGLWYDDWILLVSWLVLLATDILITYEMATGYVSKDWDDRMLVLISISSCGTTMGQTWSKSAFAVTLLRMSNTWQRTVLWIGILTLNVFMVLKIFVSWAEYCGKSHYQNYWRMQGFCVDYNFMKSAKRVGNIWNIIMDFVLALFPWMLTWRLNISKWEKIGLCGTMSLGIIIAIISAVRQAWMDDPTTSHYDDWYFWHQGLSMVWYSAEVTGTIMVQSIPVMRTLLRDTMKTLTSKRLRDAEDGRTATHPKRTPLCCIYGGVSDTDTGHVVLQDFDTTSRKGSVSSSISLSPSEVSRAIEASRTKPLARPPSGTIWAQA